MLKGRTLEVIKYLNRERLASYKEIAAELGYQERVIRYEIDRINDELSLSGMQEIQKLKKGMLLVPDNLDLDELVEGGEYIYSPEERKLAIQFRALFYIEQLNLRKLTDKMQVSRRSIQNDLDTIKNDLARYEIYLEYDRKFFLEGNLDVAYDLRVTEIRQYVNIVNRTGKLTDFEQEMQKIIAKAFLPLDINELGQWILDVTEERGWVFTDESFQWYVANVLTFAWYLIKDEKLPEKEWGQLGELGNGISRFETIIGRDLSEEEIAILSGFTKYTNRYVVLDVQQDMVTVEDIAINLAKSMGTALGINFLQDGILMKGLLNHIGPMMERVRGGLQLNATVDSFIPDEQIYVHEALLEVTAKDKYLNDLTDNESIYLSIFFIGSIRRLQQNQTKNVLLICGYGYGTTTVVKDALLNSYQIYVADSIPAYKVNSYNKWSEIDVVISTVRVELPVALPCAVVNVIFTEDDHKKLKRLGLLKKRNLSNFLAIERQIDFLSLPDKKRVMHIIKREMGFSQVRVPEKYYALSDLLQMEDISIIDEIKEWKTSVRYCTAMLEQHGSIASTYYNSIVEGMEMQDFYSVTDGVFALLHGSETAGIKESCMSLLITKKPVQFGEKSCNVIFCLASRDKKEHVPAVIRLMRMIQKTDFIDRLKACENNNQVCDVIEACEKEVAECYQ